MTVESGSLCVRSGEDEFRNAVCAQIAKLVQTIEVHLFKLSIGFDDGSCVSISLREEDYCTAAQLMGAKPSRVIGRHLLPGFMSHIIASATLSIPAMILGETALSFLGLGLRPPVTSWGVLLNEAQNINVVALYPWLMLPVLPVIIVILAFNFFGDGLRDAADPYK